MNSIYLPSTREAELNFRTETVRYVDIVDLTWKGKGELEEWHPHSPRLKGVTP